MAPRRRPHVAGASLPGASLPGAKPNLSGLAGLAADWHQPVVRLRTGATGPVAGPLQP